MHRICLRMLLCMARTCTRQLCVFLLCLFDDEVCVYIVLSVLKESLVLELVLELAWLLCFFWFSWWNSLHMKQRMHVPLMLFWSSIFCKHLVLMNHHLMLMIDLMWMNHCSLLMYSRHDWDVVKNVRIGGWYTNNFIISLINVVIFDVISGYNNFFGCAFVWFVVLCFAVLS